MKLNRKKTLITSLVVMILCMVLLAGSTYAAFTDVAQGKIKISTASFDMQVYYSQALNAAPGESTEYGDDVLATSAGEAVILTIKLDGWSDKYVAFQVKNASDTNMTFTYSVNYKVQVATGNVDAPLTYNMVADNDSVPTNEACAAYTGGENGTTVNAAGAVATGASGYAVLHIQCGALQAATTYNEVTITITFNATQAN